MLLVMSDLNVAASIRCAARTMCKEPAIWALAQCFPWFQRVDSRSAEKFQEGLEVSSEKPGFADANSMMEGLDYRQDKAFYVFGENLAIRTDIHHVTTV